MSSRLLALDFDGVLVNHKSWYVRSGGHASADPPCVEALNHITDTTGAEIVISSSWRIGTSLPELRGILKSWGVTGKVIGKTPHQSARRGAIFISEDRGSEIRRWIEGYTQGGAVEALVILDDDEDMGTLSPFLVKTEFETGLTMADAERAGSDSQRRYPEFGIATSGVGRGRRNY